ncbi:MAG: ABC transporter ATP-binding protein/permease [Alphaproteobacteria bacterium]|nr:ABC transporter ATP-binding protein/permease [Alphaproteobacteria bacterium]MDX5368219.1 ABC transporter ATP-binding protein/permease [Alphaproteobacteria bacterium]MDX5463028.1 ABC transporter ATP-binding protein/permease [Alphaproteobacteria bacterium]
MTGALPVLPRSGRGLIARLAREELRPAWRVLAVAIACMVVVALTTGATAWLLDPAIKSIFLDRDPDMLILIPAAVIVVSLVKAVASYGQAMLMSSLGQRIVSNLQIRMFGAIMRADLAWLNANHSGRIVSSFVNDAIHVRDAASRIIAGLVKETLTVVVLAGVMFYQDWQLACIALFVLVPAVGMVKRLSRRTRKASQRTFEETGTLSTLVSEALTGMRIVRAYGQEAHETEKATASIERRLAHLVKAIRARTASTPFTEAMTGVGIAAAIAYAGWKGQSGAMELNEFVSFIAAMMMAYQPVRALAGLQTQLQEGLAAAERLYAIIDLAPTIKDAPGARPLDAVRGHILFEDVSFSYGGEAPPALRDVTLDIPAGTTAALVGPSGAGKSTVLNLVPRFYDATAGAVRIDGTDVRAATLSSLRGAIALVAQEPFLFDDTIRANIAYGRPGASEDDIVQAARDAAAHDFIEGLPQGYDTRVGEAGLKLSGGQRQRIAIARAMLKNAPILLLDEATSALDTESERQVQAALRRLMRGRTTLVIAHRLSTVIDADRIFVLDGGRVAEAGTHAELLALDGLYARLYQTQLSDDTGPGDPAPTPEEARAAARG